MNARMRAIGLALLVSATVLAVASTTTPVAEIAPRSSMKSLHPNFALVDAESVNVLQSGRAVSTMKSCGQCHDTAFITSHAFHADLGLSSFAPSSKTWDSSPGLFGQWDPLRYRFLTQSGDERLDLSTAGWLMLNGERVVGGGPATTSRAGQPLTALKAGINDPETSLLDPAGNRTLWNWSESGAMEMNCFLCHLEQPNLAARKAAIRDGHFSDANTATLTGLNIVEADAKGWAWNRAAFTAEGLVNSQNLGIQDPTNANCAACHGKVHPASDVPLLLNSCDLDYPQTATTGQLVASQRINASGANLANKAGLTRSWDIHAERQLQCTDCHHALNNPAQVNRIQGKQPAHLRYDPRALEITEYLQRPDHNFARGQSAQGKVAPENKGTMRRCESCHDAAGSHQAWLPYVGTHLATLACESCHIPKMYAPAIQSLDWTVVSADGRPVQTCRGVDGTPGDIRSLVTGFEPALLKRTNVDGASLLAPYNLITTFYWVYEDTKGNKRPVRLNDLKAAFLDGGAYAADIVAAFDSDHDGTVGPRELRIDSPQKEAAVKTRLTNLGLQQVRMEGQVQPFSINHNVARGKSALNDCKFCHTSGSRLTQEIELTGFAPVTPTFEANNNVTASGDLVRQDSGALFYQPVSARDDLYVFGTSRINWVDGFGALAFVGTLLGVMGHGGMRYLAFRKRPHGHGPTRRVHMYDAYRRFWHWLQAITIVILLMTGLIIHRPDWFAVFSFSGVVSLHNILAVILVINAALSLFYHLATERMREYIPRPYGFFDDAILQTKYYVSGIFKGEPHPFEKRPDNRMNPIQKLTYFGILNVLLPLQIVTGALMWGVQYWPEIAGTLGGLPLLAPFHSLVAWLFACFIVGHVYLTTTGATPLEAIRGMVTGYEEVEDHGAQGSSGHV